VPSPNTWGNILEQSLIDLRFQLRQFLDTDLLVQVVANRLGVRCPDQISTNRFNGPLIYRNAQQYIIQILSLAFVTIRLQFKMFAERCLGLSQHFFIRQRQVIIVHWACLLCYFWFCQPAKDATSPLFWG
jgi:hypothetical protein